jgi:ABC-type nitrate/sulfonate/bicarbonate transport system substrate-binding protein
MRRILIAAAAIAVLASTPGQAAEKIRVGKAVPHAFSFTPLEIGIEKGFYQRNGVEIENIAFMGGARLHQGLAADGADIGLGAGPEFSLVSRGAYALGVAALAGPPLSMAFRVAYDSPIKSLDGLKGKKVGVSTEGSLTHWLVLELARVKGWGPDGITHVALGGQTASQQMGLKTKQIDAVIESASIAFQLEKSKDARFLAPADYVTDFHTHVIWATTKLINSKPDAVRGFLKGWFETIAFMRANKAETVRIARTVTRLDEDVESREFDMVMPMMSDDGKFNPKALKVLERSFIDLKILDTAPDTTKLLTEKFLPSAPKSM